MRISLSPHAIKSLSRSLYCQINIFTAASYCFAYRFFSGRIDDIEEFAPFGVDVLSINEKFSCDSCEFLQVSTHRYVNIINLCKTKRILKCVGKFLMRRYESR